MMIKRFLLFIAVILMVSCSNEDGSKIPGITPSTIELSTAHPEGFFQFMEGDYAMYAFRIDYGKNDTEVSKRITKETISKVQTGKYKVQLNKNSIQQVPVAISFGFSVPDGISNIAITFK